VDSPDGAPTARLRRARRDDIPALLGIVGGPEAGRARALRRILKTLAADVYVLDRARRIDGVVAVFYRRSVTAGGLVATIDALATFADTPERSDAARGADADALLAHAIERARKRGCVAVRADAAAGAADAALERYGFRAEPVRVACALAPRAEGADGEDPDEEGGAG
jgi:hypothetical protein